MKLIQTDLQDVVVVQPDVFRDERGFFLETYRASNYEKYGIPARFVQDNHSKSRRNTLRGLHYQFPHLQGKLVRVMRGAVFDVAVDIRIGSPTFGRWFGTVLDSENMLQMYVPEGFAHGFCVITDVAEFEYKCTDYYAPDCDRGIAWNDPTLNIKWPVTTPILSKKDQEYPNLCDINDSFLPSYA